MNLFIKKKLKSFSRRKYLLAPTPLEKMVNISHDYKVDIWIKREDMVGPGGGGNKTRKLAYLLADALSKNCDSLITTGSFQSNQVRQSAGAAAKEGLQAHLVLRLPEHIMDKQYMTNGNVFLCQLLGAKIYQVSFESDREKFMQDLANNLKVNGLRPYIVPFGGTNALSTLGAIDLGIEAAEQASSLGLEFDYIVLASGSGGTVAGVAIAYHSLGIKGKVLGIEVLAKEKSASEKVTKIIDETGVLIGMHEDIKYSDYSIINGYAGEGYGIPTLGMKKALQLFAQKEGLLLDPVYTGKAMAGLLDLISKKNIPPRSKVLFVHTGGSQALFAYQNLL
tara:strand:- start:407 stop:1414 length:1008 start_codon:yes stop_codon:yes gene_type:complete